MELKHSDYVKIQEILGDFANKLKQTERREVTIPLSEYESIIKNESLYFKKITLLKEINKQYFETKAKKGE